MNQVTVDQTQQFLYGMKLPLLVSVTETACVETRVDGAVMLKGNGADSHGSVMELSSGQLPI